MEIKLSELSEETISTLLNKNNFKFEVQSDGDFKIENEERLYIRLDKDKHSLRMYGWVTFDDGVLSKDGRANYVVNFLNLGSNTLRYAILKGDDLFFEYGIPLVGDVSETFIINLLNHVVVASNNLKGVYKLTSNKLKEIDSK
ncbi:hypothetical protein OGV46_09255 [Citrobacter sp. Cf108]|uniref:hypothetical protein n=1 Tax=Citrobacter sp. Cf108 TaxID=2985063 RepID=UPI002060B465|nr:hypothetical protein [Citrobacter sp. Cf108]MDM3178690.1 hypothetical protein [Citrobacter sp. Cf108]DAP49760.1 MAG TPA: hypothetical protein [Caudoviricetes sp.]